MLRIEGEHRDVDLLHDRAEERGGLDRAEALFVQRFGERVDLDQRGAEWIIRIGGAAANREVVLAKGGKQVGQRLQRHDDAGADGGGEAEQRAEDEDASASTGPSACTASVHRIHSAVKAPGMPAPSARPKIC